MLFFTISESTVAYQSSVPANLGALGVESLHVTFHNAAVEHFFFARMNINLL